MYPKKDNPRILLCIFFEFLHLFSLSSKWTLIHMQPFKKRFGLTPGDTQAYIQIANGKLMRV